MVSRSASVFMFYLFRPELILGFAWIVSPVGAITYRLYRLSPLLDRMEEHGFSDPLVGPFMSMDLSPTKSTRLLKPQ